MKKIRAAKGTVSAHYSYGGKKVAHLRKSGAKEEGGRAISDNGNAAGKTSTAAKKDATSKGTEKLEIDHHATESPSRKGEGKKKYTDIAYEKSQGTEKKKEGKGERMSSKHRRQASGASPRKKKRSGKREKGGAGDHEDVQRFGKRKSKRNLR